MKKYYKIPLTERIISANGNSLFEILRDCYPELYDREIGRVKMTYVDVPEPGVMTPVLEKMISEYNSETDAIYATMGVPKYIIGYKEDEQAQLVEYATKTPLITKGYVSFTREKEVSETDASDYLATEKDYIEVLNKLFSKKEEPKSLVIVIDSVITGKSDN